MWIARNEFGTLQLFNTKPEYKEDIMAWLEPESYTAVRRTSYGDVTIQDARVTVVLPDHFSDITFEESPKELITCG